MATENKLCMAYLDIVSSLNFAHNITYTYCAIKIIVRTLIVCAIYSIAHAN